jgi:hypothetical protein
MEFRQRECFLPVKQCCRNRDCKSCFHTKPRQDDLHARLRKQTHYVSERRTAWADHSSLSASTEIHFCMTGPKLDQLNSWLQYSVPNGEDIYMSIYCRRDSIAVPLILPLTVRALRNVWCRSFKCYFVVRYWSRPNKQDSFMKTVFVDYSEQALRLIWVDLIGYF